MTKYDYKFYRRYKGYEIHKAWRVDCLGYGKPYEKKIPGTLVYLVADEDDYIGEEYDTYEEAKKFIDSLN